MRVCPKLWLVVVRFQTRDLDESVVVLNILSVVFVYIVFLLVSKRSTGKISECLGLSALVNYTVLLPLFGFCLLHTL